MFASMYCLRAFGCQASGCLAQLISHLTHFCIRRNYKSSPPDSMWTGVRAWMLGSACCASHAPGPNTG